jgi:tetratricopeptide (TPR) repeat protein
MSDSQRFNNALSALRAGKLTLAKTQLKKLISAQPKHVGGLNLLAILFMQLGRYEEAEIYMRRALNENAMSDASHYNYGLILKALKRPTEALEQFTQALKIGPSVAETWNNRGTVFRDLRRYREALADFDQAVSLNANYADAFCNKGNVYADLKQYNDALAAYERALKLKPDLANVWLGRGNIFADLKRYDEAFAAYDKALLMKPDLENAWVSRGNAFTDLKRYDEALAAHDKALSINPDLENAWLGRGNVLADLKRYDEAFVAYDKSLSIKPDLESAWLGRGNVLFDLKQYNEAFAAYDKALSIKPDLANAWLGRGNVFADLKRYDEAFAAYDKALSIKPDLAAIYLSRGAILHILTRNNDALNSLDRAIELDPTEPLTHLFRSLVLLALGDYEEAWEEYEWRKKLARLYTNRPFDKPALSSLEGIEGATVFLYGELGLGDQIHFCRYAKLVADAGAKVVLEAPKSLFHLFKSLDGLSQLIEVGQSVPPFDYHCPLMSLPRAFSTTLEDVPNTVPYLFAEPSKIRAWANRLGAKSKLRIGLVWSGGFRQNQPETWATNQRRNMPLVQLGPLKDLDAEFYSLQKGEPAASELKELLSIGWNGPAIVDWTEELNDFSDTAALIENLDLIISVDTSTAHLAGAMAKPVWLLNRFDIEWRWLPNSPWYPTIKLYRQKEADNWDDVIDNVKTDLISTLNGTKVLR